MSRASLRWDRNTGLISESSRGQTAILRQSWYKIMNVIITGNRASLGQVCNMKMSCAIRKMVCEGFM
jgi:hypothetical protein